MFVNTLKSPLLPDTTTLSRRQRYVLSLNGVEYGPWSSR